MAHDASTSESASKPRAVELLAPAGNEVCLHAAVRAGADAVYLGVDRFNAREGADNFTLDSLQAACDYAHLRGAKIYLTANTMVLPDETDAMLELMRQAYRRGVDAFIVQDVGVAAQLKRILPQARLHISTQMNTHSAAGIEAASQLGADRVTLAREVSVEEIAHLSRIADEYGMEVETFAHGALCICYSGQCLMSSLVGGRSANRGRCAQACRLPYTLHNAAQRKPLDAAGDHLLSPKDLCSVDLLPQLVEAGVSSLKIEGRMKSPEYVSAVVGVYRQVLDRVLAASGSKSSTAAAPTDEERHILSEAFSRGFTTAYLEGKSGNDIMSYGRPNNRGVLAGRVTRCDKGLVFIRPELDLQTGDVLEFWTNRGHFAHTLHDFDVSSDGSMSFAVDKRVGPGDRVFRVRSAAAAFHDDPELPAVETTAAVRLRIGQPLLCTLSAQGVQVEASGPVVEAARTKAVTPAEVEEHIARFGGTPFSAACVDVELDEGVGIGFSQLHKVRSTAVELLQKRLLAPWHDRTVPRSPDSPHADRPRQKGCQVVALVANPACARAARKAGVDAVFASALNYKRGQAQVAGQLSQTVAQAGYPNRTLVALPAIDHDPIEGTREQRFAFNPWEYVKSGKPVIAANMGQVVRAAEEGALVEAGSQIPIANALTLQQLADWGVQRAWVSPELTLGQIQRLGEEAPLPLGITVSGAAELMVTEHCLLMSQGPCDRNCTECARRKSPHFLEDRKDFRLPVVTDCCGRSHLYNAVALDILHTAPDLIACGIDSFMVDATLLTVEQTSQACARAVRARDIALKSGDTVSKAQGATTGQLFRGIS